MQPLCWGHLRAGWADGMFQTDFLHPNAMPICPEQTLFLLMQFTKQRQPVRIPGGYNDSPDQASQKIMEHLFPPSEYAISP